MSRFYVITNLDSNYLFVAVCCWPLSLRSFSWVCQRRKIHKSETACLTRELEQGTSFRSPQQPQQKRTMTWDLLFSYVINFQTKIMPNLQEDEYVEGVELAPENDEQEDSPSDSSTTTTTTEAPKVIRVTVRPFRSNEDLLSALKKRRLNEKNNKPSGEWSRIELIDTLNRSFRCPPFPTTSTLWLT